MYVPSKEALDTAMESDYCPWYIYNRINTKCICKEFEKKSRTLVEINKECPEHGHVQHDQNGVKDE